MRPPAGAARPSRTTVAARACIACSTLTLRSFLIAVYRFSKEENIKTASAARSSEQRAIRAQIISQYPALDPFIEDIFPKKDSLILCKWSASS